MRHRLLALGVVLALAGCGGSGAKVAPVSGVVTLDGKVPPRVYVTFQPVGTADNSNPGTGSTAVTDEKGRYTLKLVENGKDGAVIGLHKVSISLQFAEDLPRGGSPDTGSADGVSGLPRLGKAKQIHTLYNANSRLTFVVEPGGTDKADFHLDSNPKP